MKPQIPWLRVFVEGVVIVGRGFELVDRFGPALPHYPGPSEGYFIRVPFRVVDPAGWRMK